MVDDLLNEMVAEQNQLLDQITDILWHMRGGLTKEDAWRLSPRERDSVIKSIKERIKNVEKTGMPLI